MDNLKNNTTFYVSRILGPNLQRPFWLSTETSLRDYRIENFHTQDTQKKKNIDKQEIYI